MLTIFTKRYIDVVLVSFLTLNKFRTLFQFFCCWLGRSKYKQDYLISFLSWVNKVPISWTYYVIWITEPFLIQLNAFVPNVPFLYPLKTSETRKPVFWRFQGVEKGSIGNEWLWVRNCFLFDTAFFIWQRMTTQSSCSAWKGMHLYLLDHRVKSCLSSWSLSEIYHTRLVAWNLIRFPFARS